MASTQHNHSACSTSESQPAALQPENDVDVSTGATQNDCSFVEMQNSNVQQNTKS